MELQRLKQRSTGNREPDRVLAAAPSQLCQSLCPHEEELAGLWAVPAADADLEKREKRVSFSFHKNLREAQCGSERLVS